MSHGPQRTARSAAARGSVMDVRRSQAQRATARSASRPKPAAATAARSGSVTPSTPAPAKPTAAKPKPTEPEKLATPVPTQPAATQAAAGAGADRRSELLAQAEAETKQQEQRKQQLIEASKKNKPQRGPLAVIIIAIMVACSLAGITVYAYLDERSKADRTAEQAQQGMPAAQDVGPPVPAVPPTPEEL